jgi:hypothetical protein
MVLLRVTLCLDGSLSGDCEAQRWYLRIPSCPKDTVPLRATFELTLSGVRRTDIKGLAQEIESILTRLTAEKQSRWFLQMSQTGPVAPSQTPRALARSCSTEPEPHCHSANNFLPHTTHSYAPPLCRGHRRSVKRPHLLRRTLSSPCRLLRPSKGSTLQPEGATPHCRSQPSSR